MARTSIIRDRVRGGGLAGPLDRLARNSWITRSGAIGAAAAVLIAAQTAWWASIALPGYFRLDDFFYLESAHAASLWDWIGRIYWEHFAPGHRAAFWLLGSATPTSWFVLQSLLLAAFAAALVFFFRTLELLFGRSWWLLVPLAVTGFAWQFSLGFAWPSAGLQIVPAFACGSLCTYAFLRNLESRRWGWLAVSALAFTVGLAFYVRVMLVPVLLVLIRYLFLEQSLAPRALARAFWADRARWAVFIFPAALYLRYFWQHHAFESPPPDSLGQVADYLRIAWFRNIVPGFLGVRMEAHAPLMVWSAPADLGTWRTIAEIAGQALVVLVLALSVARKRAAALRAWAYIGVALGATFWLTGRGKVGVTGAGAGYDPRYVSDLCWQVPLGAVFALHPRKVLELGAPWPAARGLPRARRIARAVALACALAVTIMLAMGSARSREQDWQGQRARAWVENVRSSLGRLASTGTVPRIDNGESPGYVAGGDYGLLLPLLGAPVRVGGQADAMVLPDGHVRRLP